MANPPTQEEKALRRRLRDALRELGLLNDNSGYDLVYIPDDDEFMTSTM